MKNTILILLLILVTNKFNYAQLTATYPCYAVSEDNTPPNVLFEYNPITNVWKRIGITGGNNIEAIAIDPISEIIYATDNGIFGTINATTALFTAIGNVGLATGILGEIELSDVDGLTYDSTNQIMYATHRIGFAGPGTNDLLFQIDVSTGAFVPGAMTDAVTGEAVDYAVVPAVFGGFGGNVYDVDDIAYNPLTGELFALQNQDGPGTLTELNTQTGELVRKVFDLPDDDVEGLGFNYLGELYGTTGDQGASLAGNTFILIDFVTGITTKLPPIDPTGIEEDFESFDCFSVAKSLNFETNYSGTVSIVLDNNKTVIKNNIAVVYDYNTCPDYTNLENCNPVSGVNNLAANEALWIVTKAAEYFFTNYNIQIPQINIIVNSTLEPNQASYNSEHNVIILGAGDGVERNSMSAPDIIAHEYVHAIFSSINYLGNFGIPGSINESYADIFAELIELDCFGSNNWIWASDVMLGNKKGIRNLAFPKDVAMCDTMPDTYEEEYWELIDNFCFGDDNCGIHNNSGVHSYWFYLLANGGSGINDKGFNYNVNGIGIDKAVAIIMDNMVNHLNPQSGLHDARTGSINAAFKLYPNQPQVFISVIEAWNAVGVNNGRENNIKFRITNAGQTGPVIVENNETVIPVAFDLSIDSLGMDLSADNLCFNLNLPDTYMEFFIEKTYAPLDTSEINMIKKEGEVNICITRSNEGFAKKSFAPQIASNSSIIQCKICIVSVDLPGDETSIIEPIGISGYTAVNANELISFPSSFLPFCFDFDEENMPNPNRLSLSLQLNNKNCQTLGSLEVEVINNPTTTPPYTYTIKNNKGTIEIVSEVSNNAIYKFYNLDEGKYIIEVTDSNGKVASKKFDINFVAKQNGSVCCTENLTIPPGIVSGSFNVNSTNGAIDFSEGAFIAKEGASFEVCE